MQNIDFGSYAVAEKPAGGTWRTLHGQTRYSRVAELLNNGDRAPRVWTGYCPADGGTIAYHLPMSVSAMRFRRWAKLIGFENVERA